MQENHTWPYCTSKGVGMDGKSIREAQEKYRADRGIMGGKQSTAGAPKHKVPQVKCDGAGRAYITLQGIDCFLSPVPPASTPAIPYEHLHLKLKNKLGSFDVDFKGEQLALYNFLHFF
ncbi:hypothetical protein B0H17DRAFT_1126852 [Mycena rosella]|uniref:Uncharacterized protein n=1 Tax=Mycena rosella TaxID=1033263 RepID=A0AAD7GSV1_MYCRO|nr:hypothetical protein B0H17DRAFT_1126852 [Mycena rosella]